VLELLALDEEVVDVGDVVIVGRERARHRARIAVRRRGA
jgi:hypothetical protein